MQNRLTILALFFALLPSIAVLTAAEPPSKLPVLKPEQYATPKAAAATADELEKTYAGQRKPEAVRMLLDILRGPKLGAHDGWFEPAETRYTWKWLTARCAQRSVR